MQRSRARAEQNGRGPDNPARSERAIDRAGRRSGIDHRVSLPPMRQLLSDLTVLELAAAPAGAYCGKVFADLGADVLKVETPEGDAERTHPERYVHFNTNKRIVQLAADDPGRAQLQDVLADVDVVIE